MKYIVMVRPRVKQRPRVVRRGSRVFTFTPKNPEDAIIKILLKQKFPRPLFPAGTKVKLMCVYYREANRGDEDNYSKWFADQANGIIWDDDKQIRDRRGITMIDRANPRVEFIVSEFNENEFIKEWSDHV